MINLYNHAVCDIVVWAYIDWQLYLTLDLPSMPFAELHSLPASYEEMKRKEKKVTSTTYLTKRVIQEHSTTLEIGLKCSFYSSYRLYLRGIDGVGLDFQ